MYRLESLLLQKVNRPTLQNSSLVFILDRGGAHAYGVSGFVGGHPDLHILDRKRRQATALALRN